VLAGLIRAIGLGFMDRILGLVFGVARGLIVVVVFALIAGVTALPSRIGGRIRSSESLWRRPRWRLKPLSAAGLGGSARFFGGRGLLGRPRRALLMCGIIGVVAHTPVNQVLYDGLCCCSIAARTPPAS
jgi:hypothetical protein